LPKSPLKTLLYNRDFLPLWVGQGLSLLGTQISGFALPFLILALTNSPLHAGLIIFAQRLPYLVLAMPAGVLIDRWNRKYVMVACDLVRSLAAASIPIAIIWFRLDLVLLYLVALVEGIALVFFDIADNASFPRVVPKSSLHEATALMEGTSSVAELVGPGVGGFIVGLARTIVAGAALAYFADSLSYLASVIGLLFIRIPFQAERSNELRLSLRKQIVEGLRFLYKQQHLRILAPLSMAVVLLSSPINLAVIVLARHLHIDTFTIGLIFATGGFGGLFGALSMPWINARARTGHVLIGAMGCWMLGAIVLAVAFSSVMLIIGTAICSFAIPIFFTTAYAYRAGLIPDELQGRVNSIYRLLSQTGFAVGPALAGLLLATLGARTTLWCIAVGLVVCVLAAGFTDLRKV
jgi:MFS family permease